MKTLLEYIQESLLIEAEDEKSEDSNDGEDSTDDEGTKERADIKFTIWKEPDTKADWKDDGDGYQKIEYVYNNKE